MHEEIPKQWWPVPPQKQPSAFFKKEILNTDFPATELQKEMG